jgi:hypothetical protein
MNLSERERATILAALRDRQGTLLGCAPNAQDIEGVATNSGEFRALTVAEIDALCEKLNLAQND